VKRKFHAPFCSGGRGREAPAYRNLCGTHETPKIPSESNATPAFPLPAEWSFAKCLVLTLQTWRHSDDCNLRGHFNKNYGALTSRTTTGR
jgi:hypothetical protein